MREISITGVAVNTDFSINSWVIFAGLILLMLAEVFRLGTNMKGDLETERKIQIEPIPGENFRKNNVVVHARMQPAKMVGADHYEVLELDEKRLAVIISDGQEAARDHAFDFRPRKHARVVLGRSNRMRADRGSGQPQDDMTLMLVERQPARSVVRTKRCLAIVQRSAAI